MKTLKVFVVIIILLVIIVGAGYLYLDNVYKKRTTNNAELLKTTDLIFGDSDIFEEKLTVQLFLVACKNNDGKTALSLVDGHMNGLLDLMAKNNSKSILDYIKEWAAIQFQNEDNLIEFLFIKDPVETDNLLSNVDISLLGFIKKEKSDNSCILEIMHQSKTAKVTLTKNEKGTWLITPKSVLRLAIFFGNDGLELES